MKAETFTRDTKLNIYQRLHAVMQEVSYIQKDRKIDAGQRGYMVVTHDAVTAKVRPSLVKHGVVYLPANLRVTQNGNRTETLIDLQFVNVDDPKDFVVVPSVGYGIDQGDKGPGKAMSYAVKYGLLKGLGLETGEDADLDGDVQHAADSAQSGKKVNENGPKSVTSTDPDPKKYPGISKHKEETRMMTRELMACSDDEQLNALLETKEMKALAVLSARDFPPVWNGLDEEPGSGFRGMIERAAHGVGLKVDAWIAKAEAAAKQPTAKAA